MHTEDHSSGKELVDIEGTLASLDRRHDLLWPSVAVQVVAYLVTQLFLREILSLGGIGPGVMGRASLGSGESLAR